MYGDINMLLFNTLFHSFVYHKFVFFTSFMNMLEMCAIFLVGNFGGKFLNENFGSKYWRECFGGEITFS